jgi:hypothetical protein
MNWLTDIANRAGTDKGTVIGDAHGYSCLYDVLFSGPDWQPSAIVEIGLLRGGPEAGGKADRATEAPPSVAMWQERFQNVKVFGLDISDFSEFASDRFVFLKADCGDRKQLADAADLIDDNVDLIVDDGSHASYHQQLTFLAMFEKLRSGGLYIIEDLQWCPPNYQRTLPRVPRTEFLFGRYISTGAFPYTGAIPLDDWLAIAPSIRSIFLFDAFSFDDVSSHYRRQKSLKREWDPLPRRKRPYVRRAAHLARGVFGVAFGRWLQPRVMPMKLAVIWQTRKAK